MYKQTLAFAALLSLSQAWVQFPGAAPLHQNPWHEPTPKNLETAAPVTATDAQLDATPSAPSISTVPTLTTVPIPTSSPADSELHIPFHEQILRWVKRQGGAPANPGAAQPSGFSQVSPVTTLTMMSKGQDIRVVYTQTFAKTALDPWPSPSSGEIGLGTIQGQVGVVKTKRSEPTPQTALVTIQTEVPHPAGVESVDNLVSPAESRPESNMLETRDTSAANNMMVVSSAMVAAGAFSVLVAL